MTWRDREGVIHLTYAMATGGRAVCCIGWRADFLRDEAPTCFACIAGPIGMMVSTRWKSRTDSPRSP